MSLEIASTLPRFIILDRDGVINQESDAYIKSPAEWHPLPRAIEAIAQLSQAGICLCVATNQSGVGRGFYTEETLHTIHQRMRELVIDAGGLLSHVVYCPHLPSDDCYCRKPKPGLLYQLRDQYHIPLDNTPFIGDSLRDIEAAQAAGCRPIFVRSGHGEKSYVTHRERLKGIPVFEDLWDVTQDLLSLR